MTTSEESDDYQRSAVSDPSKPKEREAIAGAVSEQVANWRKDIRSILLLFFLYILQGIPLGLIASVPFLLQSKGVPYAEQARFSLAGWPFSMKVLYAPIIDAVYWKRLGRRKSWLIPLQYLIALFMLVLACTVDHLFQQANVGALAAMFFVLNFLAASQDIAVDGWALTMLSPENVAYASTCNAVGQTLGVVMGYSGFLALDSASFANHFRAQPLDHGLVTLSQFLLFWSAVFCATTTLILFLKREEKECGAVDVGHMNVLASYRNLWRILKLRNIQVLAAFLLTARIGMAATDGLAKLKLVQAGVPKETLAFFSIPLIPIKLLLPIAVSRWVVGPRPMQLYVNTIPVTLGFGLAFPALVYWLTTMKTAGTDDGFGFWVYALVFIVIALEIIPAYIRFVAGMAFAAKVSDPAIGGTYMTLINTMFNVGATWPTTVALWLVDYLAIPLQSADCNSIVAMSTNTTTVETFTVAAAEDEGSTTTPMSACAAQVDGYYVESLACLVLGVLWLFWGRPTILRLQKKPRETWKVVV